MKFNYTITIRQILNMNIGIYIFISYGFFANFMNESTNFQVPRSLALTPPPPSSHDYLPNLTLSVGMDLDS